MQISTKYLKDYLMNHYNLPSWYKSLKMITRLSKTKNKETGNVERLFSAYTSEIKVITDSTDTQIISTEIIENLSSIFLYAYMNRLEDVKRLFDYTLKGNPNNVTEEWLYSTILIDAIFGRATDVCEWIYTDKGIRLSDNMRAFLNGNLHLFKKQELVQIDEFIKRYE